MDDFLANEAKGTKVIGAHSLQEMVSTLKKPRRIILLVKAGSAVDDFINKLVRQMFTLPVTSCCVLEEFPLEVLRCSSLVRFGMHGEN